MTSQSRPLPVRDIEAIERLKMLVAVIDDQTFEHLPIIQRGANDQQFKADLTAVLNAANPPTVREALEQERRIRAESQLSTLKAAAEGMVEKVEQIAQQPLVSEETMDAEDADFVGAYDICVQTARSILALYRAATSGAG